MAYSWLHNGRNANLTQANQLSNEESIEAIIRKRSLDGVSTFDQLGSTLIC
jgi:hypothetical protein